MPSDFVIIGVGTPVAILALHLYMKAQIKKWPEVRIVHKHRHHAMVGSRFFSLLLRMFLIREVFRALHPRNGGRR